MNYCNCDINLLCLLRLPNKCSQYSYKSTLYFEKSLISTQFYVLLSAFMLCVYLLNCFFLIFWAVQLLSKSKWGLVARKMFNPTIFWNLLSQVKSLSFGGSLFLLYVKLVFVFCFILKVGHWLSRLIHKSILRMSFAV